MATVATSPRPGAQSADVTPQDSIRPPAQSQNLPGTRLLEPIIPGVTVPGGIQTDGNAAPNPEFRRLPWKPPHASWSVTQALGVAIDIPLWTAAGVLSFTVNTLGKGGREMSNLIARATEKVDMPTFGGLASVLINSTANLVVRTGNSLASNLSILGVHINLSSGNGAASMAKTGLLTGLSSAGRVAGDLLWNVALFAKDVGIGTYRVLRPSKLVEADPT